MILVARAFLGKGIWRYHDLHNGSNPNSLIPLTTDDLAKKKEAREIPTFSPEYLNKVCYHVFRAYGASEEEARTVARHLVDANLTGHDSHGVIQVPTYVERIRRGQIVPGAPFEVGRYLNHSM